MTSHYILLTTYLLALQQWLEELGISQEAAVRYTQGLANPDIGYTEVAHFISAPMTDEGLRSAGINVLRHRTLILQAQRMTTSAEGCIRVILNTIR
jgi:hypothetical protein